MGCSTPCVGSCALTGGAGCVVGCIATATIATAGAVPGAAIGGTTGAVISSNL